MRGLWKVAIRATLSTIVVLGLCGGLAAAGRSAHSELRSSPAASLAGDCSEQTAQSLARQYKLGDSTYGYPVAQVLCGAFTGPNSNAMAFSFHYYGCIAVSGFAVFRFQDGAWQLVLKNGDHAISISAAGSDIREKKSVFLRGDSRCVSTGGTKTRLWHWNGQQLVAGAWKQRLTLMGIYSPSRNLACEMADDPARPRSSVDCLSRKPPHLVSMNLAGRLKICPRGGRCTADFGEYTPFKRLAYGHKQTVGRFRCSSARAGITCVVISSGRGFRIDKVGVYRVRR